MSSTDGTLRESNRNAKKRSASPSKQEQQGRESAKRREIRSDYQKVEPNSDQENMERAYELDMDILQTELADDEPDCRFAESSSFLNYQCTKGNHKDYVPIDSLFYPTLPEAYEREDIASVVKALGKLVVKIEVNHSSPRRPKLFPGKNAKFPKGHCRATGKIIFSERKRDFGQEWGEIKIATSSHVVFDQSEAEHTTCILNFDNADSEVVKLKCTKVTYVNTEQDNCLLICKTGDMNLVKQLMDNIYDFVNTHKELHEKYRNLPKNDLVLTVSHPHGHTKQVSIGSYAEPDKNKYHLTTCKGSSGAPIYRLNQEKVWVLEVHSGSADGLAVSGLQLNK
ncbi:unnamed protein product [Lymnaea stagnalis]|uniref:Uncharacterized protein n=1 Tax=Lymnaea stagnalis TaxID=6523 RepID=A0AAV2HGL1_LYMST